MRIVVLTENTTRREDLRGEHGLSLYIETGGRKLLFDAGQSGAFWDNAEALGIDLTQVDTAVLSHGHYDHGGGMARFLAENHRALLWVHPAAFEPHYNALDCYIGLDPALGENPRVRFSREGQTLGPGLTLYHSIPCPHGIRPFGLTAKQGNALLPEDFRHEQYLLAEEGNTKILFSGCSHRGILNIAEYFRPQVLVGGFHFMKLPPEGDEIGQAAAALKGWPIRCYTGHCTGQAQYDALKERLGEQLQPLDTGMEIIIS